MTGTFTVAPPSGAALFRLNTAAGQIRAFESQTGGTRRWSMRFATSEAETGGSAGSNFTLLGYSDDNSSNKTVLGFNRASGLGTVYGDPVDPFGIATKQYVDGHLKKVNPAADTIPITDPTNQKMGRWDIVDDSSATASWPDRLQFQFNGVRTGGFNEYGEVRSDAAKASTVAARFHGHLTAGVPDSTGNIMEVREGRNVGATVLGVSRTAVAATVPISAPNISGGVVVLATGAPVPAGTPAGTLIVRYTP